MSICYANKDFCRTLQYTSKVYQICFKKFIFAGVLKCSFLYLSLSYYYFFFEVPSNLNLITKKKRRIDLDIDPESQTKVPSSQFYLLQHNTSNSTVFILYICWVLNYYKICVYE